MTSPSRGTGMEPADWTPLPPADPDTLDLFGDETNEVAEAPAHQVDEHSGRALLNPLNQGSRSALDELTPSIACAALSTGDSGARGYGAAMTLPQIPAPSAPGSETSEDAADALTAQDIQREQRRVLLWYDAQSEPQTRHACARALYEGETGPACGRINALIAGRLLEECGRIGKRALVQITKLGRTVASELAQQPRAA